MRSLARGILGTLLVALIGALGVAFAFPAQAAEAKKADPTLALFVKSFHASMTAAGKDFGKCEFTIVGEEPDGPGRLIGVACPKAAAICVFVVVPNEDKSDVIVQPVQCHPNPEYVAPDDTPKTSI